MAATKLMNCTGDFVHPLGLHPPSPQFLPGSELQPDSISDGYAMECNPTELWTVESSIDSYVDDRCPTEWEHPPSLQSPQSPESFAWSPSGLVPRPIDALNITDESRVVPEGVAARFATRELNALRDDSLTALPQSPTDETPRSSKLKTLDSALLRKLFKATIDEKRRIDESMRQKSQDVSAKVTAKAGVEARSRRVVEQGSPTMPDDHEVVRGLRKSLSGRLPGIASEQLPPVSETKSESAKHRSSQDSQRSSPGGYSRRGSLDTVKLRRIAGKNGKEAFAAMPRRLPSFSSVKSSNVRALATTKEEVQVKVVSDRLQDLPGHGRKKLEARDARIKQRDSCIVDLQNFLRETGPIEIDSPVIDKPKSSKPSKQQQQQQPKDKIERIKKTATAAKDIFLSPLGPNVQQAPSASHDATAPQEISISKRRGDLAHMQATVESTTSQTCSDVLAEVTEGPRQDIERDWAQVTPQKQNTSTPGLHRTGRSVDPTTSPIAVKMSPRPGLPKLAIKIPGSSGWKEISYTQGMSSPSARAKSPATAISPTISKQSVPNNVRQQDADAQSDEEEDDAKAEDARSDEEHGEGDQVDDREIEAVKPPMERKDSKTASLHAEPAAHNTPSQKGSSYWFRDYTSPMSKAFEFRPVEGTSSNTPPLRTPQAASKQIQGVVEGWVQEAHESRSLKLAAAKQVLRAPRSPVVVSRSRGLSRPSTSRGFRERPDEWMFLAQNAGASPAGALNDASRHAYRRSRSAASSQRFTALSLHTQEEVGQGVVNEDERKSTAWAAASSRSTKVPIKSMSFKSVPPSRAQSRPSSRAQSRCSSVAPPISPQKGWAGASQGWQPAEEQSMDSWPEYPDLDHISKFSTAEQSRRRPSLPSTHRSQKFQGASIQSLNSRKSSGASHHSSTTSCPQSIHEESGCNSLVSQQLDEPPMPALPESSHHVLADEPSKQPTTRTTVFAGKGWISPHPLSRSPTEVASSPQSRIMLPSEAFPHGATMTFDEWKQMQEHGLRLHHNHSITESSRTYHGVYQDERYRHAAWEGRGSVDEGNLERDGSQSPVHSSLPFSAKTPHATDSSINADKHRGSSFSKANTRPSVKGSSLLAHGKEFTAPVLDARNDGGVSFVTGSAKFSRHQRSSSA